MKKVLWFSSLITHQNRCTTGTWHDTLSRLLANSGRYAIGNIAFSDVPNVIEQNIDGIKQWVLPYPKKFTASGTPRKSYIHTMSRIVDDFNPDLIHVWGVEGFSGLLTARRTIKHPAILEIQGIKGEIAKVYQGGLSGIEQRQCLGIKEILTLRSINKERQKFLDWGLREKEIIKGHRHILTQTTWAESHVKAINPDCKTYLSKRALQINTMDAKKLERLYSPSRKKQLFVSAAYSAPFKGLHTAIRATAHLRKAVPEIELRIAGDHVRSGIRKDGYIRWLESIIRELDISSNVKWLGALNADQIRKELEDATAFILPSFLENCSTSMQEAMAVGTPVVASYVGGLPSLAQDEISALFFPAGDDVMCARQVMRLIEDVELTKKISENSLEISKTRNDPESILYSLTSTYSEVMLIESLSNIDANAR